MSSREISYAEAINEATSQAMELDEKVIVLGQLADTPAGIFGTTTGLVQKFGQDRVQDFQVAENAMTAVAMGASLTGIRPVVAHQRLDFMIYSLDPIVNWLSLWYFKSNSKSCMPVTIRTVVGKGWGQGPQHSKSLQSWFAHIPGLRVAMPATAYDAKGLLLESIFGETPTMFIEGRSLFSMKTHVPQEPYRVRFGQAATLKRGKDVTIVALGLMVPFVGRVAAELAKEGIDAEVIDLRTISPWDREAVFSSVSKTGRLVVADPAWKSFGITGEIVSVVVEEIFGKLKASPLRLAHPDSHTPMSQTLEAAYYPQETSAIEQIKSLF